jgi:hypothetical protein
MKGTRWEVFDPRDGRAITSTRFRIVAWLLTALVRGLDYAPQGEGWTRTGGAL